MIALRFAVVLPTLLVAHNVADHVVQTDHQAAHKATSWAAMAGHVGGYQALQLGALLAVSRATGTSLSWKRVLVGGAFSAISHAFLDRRWPVRRVMELTGSPGFARGVAELPALAVAGRAPSSEADDLIGFTLPWSIATPLHGPYLADQALHHGCLLLAALVMAGGRS